MEKYVELTRDAEVVRITLARGRVNALNPAVVHELDEVLDTLETEREVRAVVLEGRGAFFSFGFDVPEFMSYSREDFTRFLLDFTELYRRVFVFPKPVVAGLNGHAIAGGCMLALACDRRVLATGKARISLNEITFGASVFAGCVETLKLCVGSRNAETVLLTGEMFAAEQALALGLVDRVAPPDRLAAVALEEARSLACRDTVAFRGIKQLLREPIAEQMRRREPDSVQRFVEIWYSEATREKLRKIEIRA